MEDSAHTQEYHNGPIVPLPVDKLRFPSTEDEARKLAVLVETGSFNPPTYMHLRMFESGQEALAMHGYHFMGGYMSPVNSAYGKKGLVLAEHRIRMCQLAAEGFQFIMVDPWEALQPTYQRTLKVLVRVRDALQDVSTNSGSIRVMLLCGADLLESFTVPGIWLPDQVEIICQDYGLVCVQRGGRDLRKLIRECALLSKYNENIIIADNFESDISSTKVRENLAKNLPVDCSTPASVLDYIKSNNLYSTDV